MGVSTRLELDEEGRTYLSGDPIKGRVHLVSERGPECKRVQISCFWRTRGLGADDQGLSMPGMTIHEGPLPARSAHSISFEFPAPKDSFSYRGRIFRLEHFAQATVDFGSDKIRTERVPIRVSPGPGIGPPPRPLFRVPSPTTTRATPTARLVAGGAVTLIGLFTWPQGLVLVPVGLWLLLPLYARKLAEGRLGSVAAYADAKVVAPGRSLEVKLRIRPSVPVKILGAWARVRAEETCAAPIGEHPAVHRKEVFSKRMRITGPCTLNPGAPSAFKVPVPIPEGGPFSFSSVHNRVAWEAAVHVEISSWPDWEKTIGFVVWPDADWSKRLASVPDEAEVAALTSGEGEPTGPVEAALEPDPAPTPQEAALGPETEPTPAEEAPLHVEASLEWESGLMLEAETLRPAKPALEVEQVSTPEEEGPIPLEPPMESERPSTLEPSPMEVLRDPEVPAEVPAVMSAEDASEPQPPSAFPGPPKAEPVPPPVSPDPSTEPYLDLSAAVAAILNEDALSGSRKPLIEALLGEPVLFHLEIEKVERTFGRFSDAGYRNGRTVPGTIAGTEILVCVWYPEAQNEEVDSYDKGSTYLVEGTVEEWDTLRKRPNIRARRERG